jgi:hypothetical protein
MKSKIKGIKTSHNINLLAPWDAMVRFFSSPAWHLRQRHKMAMHWYRMCKFYELDYQAVKWELNVKIGKRHLFTIKTPPFSSIQTYCLGWAYYPKYHVDDRKTDIVLGTPARRVYEDPTSPFRQALLMSSKGKEVTFDNNAVYRRMMEISNNIQITIDETRNT